MLMEAKDDLKEYMLKEIEVIQGVINRMGHNSFVLKGWAVTLVAAALLLKGSTHHAWVAWIPLLAFWYLDGYFLWQERMYRKLYDWVVENRLSTDECLFSMNAYKFRTNVQTKFKIMFSETLGLFYGSVAALITIYMILDSVTNKGGCP